MERLWAQGRPNNDGRKARKRDPKQPREPATKVSPCYCDHTYLVELAYDYRFAGQRFRCAF